LGGRQALLDTLQPQQQLRRFRLLGGIYSCCDRLQLGDPFAHPAPVLGLPARRR
jgi:hypothetical protein